MPKEEGPWLSQVFPLPFLGHSQVLHLWEYFYCGIQVTFVFPSRTGRIKQAPRYARAYLAHTTGVRIENDFRAANI